MSTPARHRRTGTAIPRVPAAERREQLLSAARDVIVADGLAMVTMERVARQAQVSKPVLYSHFENRAALLRALLVDFWTEIDQRLRDRVSVDTPLEQYLTTIVNSYFDVLDQGGRALQELLASGAEEPDIVAARRERFAQVEHIWSGKYQRDLGISRRRADTAAAIFRSALAGAGEYWIIGPGSSRAECIRVCLAVMRGGLKELQRPASVR